jgi:glycerophosphoryl diester phosphodiesterase
MNIKDYFKLNFLVVGHRGLPSKYIENTMESFENAFKFTDIVELDVHLSADNEVYVMHDFNLQRLASVNREIEEMRSSEIDRVNLVSGKIPKLSELLRKYSEKYFLVELKTVHDDGYIVKNELAKYTVETIESIKMEDHVCVISFDPYAIRRSRELNKNIMLGFDYDHHSEKYIGKIDCKDLKSMDVSLFLPEFEKEYMDKFKKMQEAGYFIVPWSIDTPNAGTLICESGLNGYITNKVDIMPKKCISSRI